MPFDFDSYKDALEKQHNQNLKDILFDYYVRREIGPSVGAQQLGIPRQVFVHFLNLYNLTDLKFEQFED